MGMCGGAASENRLRDGAKLQEFRVPPGEIGRGGGFARRHAIEKPVGDGRGQPLHFGLTGGGQAEERGEMALRGIRHRDLTRLCKAGQAGGEVHHIAGHGIGGMGGASRLRRDRLAIGQPGMGRDRQAARQGKAAEAVHDVKARAGGAFDIIAMGNRRAKDRHYAVADMLVDIAAVFLDDPVGEGEIGLDHAMQRFGVERPAERGVAGEVGEKHGDGASFTFGLWRRGRSR